jgi:ATP/maltotriose-dependent transcriptional regulator MalT
VVIRSPIAQGHLGRWMEREALAQPSPTLVLVTYCSVMAEIASAGERIPEGEAALARGSWIEARTIFEEELKTAETVQALEGLSWAAWWVDDAPVCLDARERAYRLYRRAGDRGRAAMMAVWLGEGHIIFRGDHAVANGWFQRAARLLDGLDPCPAHGWLAVLRGFVAVGTGDTAGGTELAATARDLGRRLGLVCLEMFALAVEGVALVNEGRVEAGMCCLDEATAAALGGEFEHMAPAGWTCCLLIQACERVRDYDRAAQWCEQVEQFSRRMHINFATGICRAHYGAVLTWRGNWPQAERELGEAAEHLAANRSSWIGDGLVRLADLRRRQGRVAEAERLLSRTPGHSLAPLCMAELSLDRAETAVARDLLEPLLRRLPAHSRTLRAHPLELMVRVQTAAGEVESAAAHLAELRAIADALGTQPLRASVCFSEGLVATAGGHHETARERLEDAVELFAASGAPYEMGQARLELAGVLVALGREEAAVREVTVALRRSDELGAVGQSARARKLLEHLGVAPPARNARHRGGPLTSRQLEVLRLVAQGLTDNEIAVRLVLSKHTVHRHVQNAYARLGCSSRASAVAKASRLHLL